MGPKKINMSHFWLLPTPLGLGEPLLSDMNYNQSSLALKRKYPNGPQERLNSQRKESKKKKIEISSSCSVNILDQIFHIQ